MIKSVGRWAAYYLGAPIGALVLWLIHKSLRWQNLGLFAEGPRLFENKPASIFAFWHGRQLFAPWMYLDFRGSSRATCATLISKHADGRLIARVIAFLGLESVAGSSTRGGTEAMLILTQRIKNGSHVAFTPDGPKGPKQKLKAGVIKLAQITGAPIYLGAYNAERRWQFRSWDGMILPKPFSRAVRAGIGPIYIPAELSEAAFTEKMTEIETALNELTTQVDQVFK